MAEIVERKDEGDAVRFTLEAPRDLAKFIAPKGSVALDGTSLTVNKVEGTRFDVLLIHHSLTVTTWGERKAGDRVNLEIDTMARYAARLAEAAKRGALSSLAAGHWPDPKPRRSHEHAPDIPTAIFRLRSTPASA